MSDRITVATDGSSRGNPGPAGWAWVESADRWQAGSLPEATSIVAELTAIYRLVLAAPPTVPLLVLSDSEFAVNVCMKWAAGWKRAGWRKRDGEPVANRALVQALHEAIKERPGKVEVQWVRGHNGHPLNEAADRLATGVAVKAAGRDAKIAGPGWGAPVGRTLGKGAGRRTEPVPSRTRPKAEPTVEFCPSCDGAINPLTLHCRCGSM